MAKYTTKQYKAAFQQLPLHCRKYFTGGSTVLVKIKEFRSHFNLPAKFARNYALHAPSATHKGNLLIGREQPRQGYVSLCDALVDGVQLDPGQGKAAAAVFLEGLGQLARADAGHQLQPENPATIGHKRSSEPEDDPPAKRLGPGDSETKLLRQRQLHAAYCRLTYAEIQQVQQMTEEKRTQFLLQCKQNPLRGSRAQRAVIGQPPDQRQGVGAEQQDLLTHAAARACAAAVPEFRGDAAGANPVAAGGSRPAVDGSAAATGADADVDPAAAAAASIEHEDDGLAAVGGAAAGVDPDMAAAAAAAAAGDTKLEDEELVAAGGADAGADPAVAAAGGTEADVDPAVAATGGIEADVDPAVAAAGGTEGGAPAAATPGAAGDESTAELRERLRSMQAQLDGLQQHVTRNTRVLNGHTQQLKQHAKRHDGHDQTFVQVQQDQAALTAAVEANNELQRQQLKEQQDREARQCKLEEEREERQHRRDEERAEQQRQQQQQHHAELLAAVSGQLPAKPSNVFNVQIKGLGQQQACHQGRDREPAAAAVAAQQQPGRMWQLGQAAVGAAARAVGLPGRSKRFGAQVSEECSSMSDR
ncbi:hypothetical protein OEZ85_014215 [Tetradesmus obliquus]|uniref:Uncharacterized protein n=1 Tax=Tetradesmus obliquus TaxID=3088 RepID=A0ABY8U7A1_TETOB|nr:hypothetical protein OEZ85_014215 [Tetradesmus obliquus]